MSDADPGGIESRDSKDSELALLRLEAGSTRSTKLIPALLIHSRRFSTPIHARPHFSWLISGLFGVERHRARVRG